MKRYASINPLTGKTIAEYQIQSRAEALNIVDAAQCAVARWKRTDFGERSKLMRGVAEILRNRVGKLAKLMAGEMGKPLAEGRAEIEKCAQACEYYAEHAADFLRTEPVVSDATNSFVVARPLGLILAVMPWNFPFWQVFRFAVPALMAGNGVLLKHASNVPACAQAIEEIILEAGFPKSIFCNLYIDNETVGTLIDHPDVHGVTLTGSTNAGKMIAARAGNALKKTVLELGGSDPYVILADADLEQAVSNCVTSRLINGGQSCIAAKRFIVEQAVLNEFTERFVAAMRAKKFGDPFADDTDIGPMARLDLRDELHAQVEDSVKAGATCLLGGQIPEGIAAFYPPTVLTQVSPGMPAYDEELFGPVAAIIEASDEEEAIRIANDSVFGLGAAVFTADIAKGERIAAEELEAGACFINSFVRSDPRLPFGGIKTSGFGRELSREGIREFVNIKTVYRI